MGSIVGGLYATWMSSQEMEDALATMDWDGSFQDKVTRKEMPFRRKFDESSFLTKVTIGIQDGHTAFPTGLVEGQKLNFILRQLTLPSALVDDFDKLSIPFRATATDVASGEGIVLSHGNIADAMRASMAFPGLFAPVEMDGRLLVDGGVAENFPVKTARKAGAQVLVAVNIGTPPAGKEQLTSLVKIINQVTSAATARNVRESKEAAFSSGKNVLQLLATGGSPVKTDLPYYDGFKLGGFRRLSGYTLDELYGPYMAFGSVTYLREINRFKTSIIGGAYYLGATLEAGNAWRGGSDVSLSDLRYAGSVFMGIDSPLGPVYLAYGLAEGGRRVLSFQVGVAF
jgi:predicted acylesterase/phospholipase RssA